MVAEMWDGHANNVDSQGKDNLISFPWLSWSNSKITKISYWISFKIYCVCLDVQFLARIFGERAHLSLIPRHCDKEIWKDSAGQDPRGSKQTEKIMQVVNLLKVKTGLFPSSQTKIYFYLICYLTQWEIYDSTLNHKIRKSRVTK